MRRREVLKTGGSACALLAVAGCTSSAEDGVHITQTISESEFQNVVAEVYLRNRADSAAQATLHARIEMDAGDTYEKTRDVGVTPGVRGGTTERFRFDVGRNVNAEDYSPEASLTDVSYE